jgi:hypothetical protein
MEAVIKRLLIGLLLVLQVFFIPASTVNAADVTTNARDKANYRAQNDVLYYGECVGVGSGAGKSLSPDGGGGGPCGEQGYSSGKRNSQANKDQIYSFFKSKGLSDTAIAGIMGNMQSESAFMPDANNGNSAADGGGGGCRGVVQWCSGRNRNLTEFAQQKGTDWSCLGTQLEFIWHEVTQTGEAGVMDSLSAAKTPTDAAVAWANGYERMKASELPGRAPNAEKLYTEYTGQAATPLADSSSNSSGNSNCANAGEVSTPGGPGSLPDGECTELIERVKKLESEGKIVLMNKAPEMRDIENCGKVTTCPSSGHIGVEKHTLQVLIAIAEQSGQVAKVYALNSDHHCDKGEHGKGLGIDIPWASSTPQGQAIYKFLYNNAAALGINKLIYNPPPDGLQCMYGGKPTGCNTTYAADIGGHGDHIHVSL